MKKENLNEFEKSVKNKISVKKSSSSKKHQIHHTPKKEESKAHHKIKHNSEHHSSPNLINTAHHKEHKPEHHAVHPASHAEHKPEHHQNSQAKLLSNLKEQTDLEQKKGIITAGHAADILRTIASIKESISREVPDSKLYPMLQDLKKKWKDAHAPHHHLVHHSAHHPTLHAEHKPEHAHHNNPSSHHTAIHQHETPQVNHKKIEQIHNAHHEHHLSHQLHEHAEHKPSEHRLIHRPASHIKRSTARPLKKHHRHRAVRHHTAPKIHHKIKHHSVHHKKHPEHHIQHKEHLPQAETASENNPLKYSKFQTDKDIAMDFATRVHRLFDHLIKATVLFGSTASGEAKPGSDIDVIIIIDDAAINWDLELTSWYREELAKLVAAQNYGKDLHINTIRLTTWWRDLIHGDPVVLNIIRNGQVLIDIGGFFSPIKALMMQGKIHSTPEAVYAALQRSPQHLTRSKIAILGSIEGVYWCMVEAAQAALITLGKLPPSPEHVTKMLHESFVQTGIIKSEFVKWYRDIYVLHKQIAHGEIRHVKASEIEAWQVRAEEFMKKMVDIIDKLIEARKNAVQK